MEKVNKLSVICRTPTRGQICVIGILEDRREGGIRKKYLKK